MNILIIDDEESIVKNISDCVIQHYKNVTVFTYTQPESLLEDIKNIQIIDIAFVDIKIPSINGIEVGTFISTRYPAIKLIFISGYPDCVSEIFFNVQPYGFIEKPIQADKIYKYIDKIIADENEEITFDTTNNQLRVKSNHILWLESKRKKISVMTTDGCSEIYGKLSEVEPLLPTCFVRCHQSFIVNLKYTTKCDLNDFTMLDGTLISISRSYKKQAIDRYYSFRGKLL